MSCCCIATPCPTSVTPNRSFTSPCRSPAHAHNHTHVTRQERASKQLPGAGQHFSFGALEPWEDLLQYLDEKKSELCVWGGGGEKGREGGGAAVSLIDKLCFELVCGADRAAWHYQQCCGQPDRRSGCVCMPSRTLNCCCQPDALILTPHMVAADCCLKQNKHQHQLDRKLLLLVRHGQAVSNFLSDTLGPDEWFKVEGTCQYDDKQGTVYNVFDAGGDT